MDYNKREYLIARICSGVVRVKLDKIYTIKIPTTEQKYLAEELYQDQLKEAELQDLFSEEELLEYMLEIGCWDLDREKLLKILPKEIEDFKVGIYKAIFKTDEKNHIRAALQIARDKLDELTRIKNQNNYLSCSGFAELARSRYLIGRSLYISNEPVFKDDSFWKDDTDLLDEIMVAYSKEKLSNTDIRFLARNDPWKGIWNSHKQGSFIFNVSAIDYTDEQRCLVGYSSLYDSVEGHPECPSDDIINDDDALDGWLISQKRESDKRKNRVAAEELIGNEKIRGSDEIFIPANTREDAEKIDSLNDEQALAAKKRKLNYVAKKGQVDEANLPEVKKRLQMKRNELAAKALKG